MSDCSFLQRALSIHPSSLFTSQFGCYMRCVYIAVWLLHVLYLRHCLVVTCGVFTSLFGCYKWCIYIAVWLLQVVYLHRCLVVTCGVFTYQFGCYKWCIYIAVWLLHGWCHSKLLPSRRVLCTPYNHAPYHVTSCKFTYVRCMRV